MSLASGSISLRLAISAKITITTIVLQTMEGLIDAFGEEVMTRSVTTYQNVELRNFYTCNRPRPQLGTQGSKQDAVTILTQSHHMLHYDSF